MISRSSFPASRSRSEVAMSKRPRSEEKRPFATSGAALARFAQDAVSGSGRNARRQIVPHLAGLAEGEGASSAGRPVTGPIRLLNPAFQTVRQGRAASHLDRTPPPESRALRIVDDRDDFGDQ